MTLVDDLAIPLEPEEATRRKVLGLIGTSALGAAGLGTLIVSVRYLEPNVSFEEDTRHAVGRPEDIAVGTALVLAKQKVFIVRTEAGFVALSAICTHLGCVTQLEAATGRITCPCHGSVFSRDGSVAQGPAPKRLVRVALTFERGVLIVEPGKRVADDFVLEAS